MKIGIDFDNTIVCYDGVFQSLGVAEGVGRADEVLTKSIVRDRLRARGDEERWIEIQGLVYGARMADALAYPGFLEFVERADAANFTICIVSHKTKHPFRGPSYDLHQAAKNWLTGLAAESPSLIKVMAFFEETKEKKLSRIDSEACDFFIDDLPEILLADGFPKNCTRILFDPIGEQADRGGIVLTHSWSEISKTVFT